MSSEISLEMSSTLDQTSPEILAIFLSLIADADGSSSFWSEIANGLIYQPTSMDRFLKFFRRVTDMDVPDESDENEGSEEHEGSEDRDESLEERDEHDESLEEYCFEEDFQPEDFKKLPDYLPEDFQLDPDSSLERFLEWMVHQPERIFSNYSFGEIAGFRVKSPQTPFGKVLMYALIKGINNYSVYEDNQFAMDTFPDEDYNYYTIDLDQIPMKGNNLFELLHEGPHSIINVGLVSNAIRKSV